MEACVILGLTELQPVKQEASPFKGGEKSRDSSYKGSIGQQGMWSFDQKINFKTSGLGVNLVGTLPLDDFTLLAKAGYHHLKTEGKLKESFGATGVGGISESGNATIRKWTPSFGVGASYAMTPSFSVVAEYERYKNVASKKVYVDGDKTSFKHSVDLASIGLRYNF